MFLTSSSNKWQRVLISLLAVIALSGQNCGGGTTILNAANRYPACINGQPPAGSTVCDPQKKPPPPPTTPGLPERGNCSPNAPAKSAFLMDNLDYSTFIYTATCPLESGFPTNSSYPGVLTEFQNFLQQRNWIVWGWSDATGGSQQDVRLMYDASRPLVSDPQYDPIRVPMPPNGGLDNQVFTAAPPGTLLNGPGADSTDLMVFSGHGVQASTVPTDVGSWGTEPGRQELLLSRSYPNPVSGLVNTVCRVKSATQRWNSDIGQYYSTGEVSLGAGLGARTSAAVFLSSCSMNDLVWPDLDHWNRIGQDFGFERSPKLDSTLFMRDWAADTKTLSNQEAWILRGIKIFGDKEQQVIDASPVASAIGLDFMEAADLFTNSSLFLGCRVGQKPSAAAPDPMSRVWRKATTPCATNDRCGKPRFCDQGFQTPALNKLNQPLGSTPMRGNSAPSSMIETTITPSNRSDSEVAAFVAKIANDIAPETGPFDPAVVEGFVRANRATGTWDLNHLGGGVLFGFHASRGRVRIVNRDVRDFITVSGAPLDIGPQAAFDIANQVAREAGLQILGLSEEQTGADRPSLNVILDGRSSAGVGFDVRVFGYVFSMFRTINGQPVLDLESTIVIHRSGQLYYSDLIAAGVSTSGKAGFEQSTTGQVLEVPFKFGDFANLFQLTFRNQYGRKFAPNPVWSGFAYVVTHANKVEPAFIVRFVPGVVGSEGAVGGLRTWAFRVSDPFGGPLDLPYSRLGEDPAQ